MAFAPFEIINSEKRGYLWVHSQEQGYEPQTKPNQETRFGARFAAHQLLDLK